MMALQINEPSIEELQRFIRSQPAGHELGEPIATTSLGAFFRWGGEAVLCSGLFLLLTMAVVNRIEGTKCEHSPWEGVLFEEVAPSFGIAVPRAERCAAGEG